MTSARKSWPSACNTFPRPDKRLVTCLKESQDGKKGRWHGQLFTFYSNTSFARRRTHLMTRWRLKHGARRATQTSHFFAFFVFTVQKEKHAKILAYILLSSIVLQRMKLFIFSYNTSVLWWHLEEICSSAMFFFFGVKD